MKFLCLMMVMLLVSCASPLPVIQTETKVIDTSCSWVKVISISLQDQFTDGTARQILAHNKLVVKNCPAK